ncbi:MAG: BolA family protein [Alphaproteobacteria bacterium]
MSVAEQMRRKLELALSPAELEIADDSHLHAGHAGARPGGESHFRIRVVASAFRGLTRVERQRRIYAVLTEELSGPVHALQITASAPEDPPSA